VQLQQAGSLTNLVWENLGQPTNATNALVPRDLESGFFRLREQL
jgi:hypothetical protein